jgi:hydroxymethylglutaryl-CoA lyase
MFMGYPKVTYKEEALREGMQIEDASIPVADKLRLLDALSETGLKNIVVGSFVSPRYTPQMAKIDELMADFTPRPGVNYTALALNERGKERAKQYSPPLSANEDGKPLANLGCHLCDVFVRRNANRSQEDEISAWESIVKGAVERGDKTAGISLNAAWGSNFVGPFSLDVRMAMLERQHTVWDEAGIQVTAVSFADPMSWTMPHELKAQLLAIKERWPDIEDFGLHLHNARGMAIVSAYSAMETLDESDTLRLDGSIGGIGGCPYCGNGRATGLMPTEDVLHMLEEMGIDTGVDMDKLIDCVWMLEEILGRTTMGHVSKAGPRPHTPEEFYDPNSPFVETFDQAKHFKLGPEAYEGGIYPWREPIRSHQRPETLAIVDFPSKVTRA